MSSKSVVVLLVGLVALGCSTWQKREVRAQVVKELQCEPEHAVAKGPFEPATQDGEVTLSANEKLWRGSCAVAWDERVVVVCNPREKNCRLVDVGPPRMKPRKPPKE